MIGIILQTPDTMENQREDMAMEDVAMAKAVAKVDLRMSTRIMAMREEDIQTLMDLPFQVLMEQQQTMDLPLQVLMEQQQTGAEVDLRPQ